MKPKNIMLLGFINRAVDYLNRHMDEEPDARLAELKNIDLESLKDELNDNLDLSLGTMQSTMSTLLKAGNEAFDEFIEENHQNKNVSDQLNRIFDVDFDDEKKKSQEELAKLLSFYNLENDFGIEETPEDKALREIAKNVTKDDANEALNFASNKSEDEAIDSIFNEIVTNENKKNVEPSLKNQSYVSSLISELREQLVKEEQQNKEYENKNKEIYDRISKIYTYLPTGFIRSVYELKESLANDYEFGKKIIVLHRVRFDDVDNLRKFVEIGMNHNYTINADENKKIVDIFKEFVNEDGKILTNIYEIANQGYLLQGTYEGYNVIVNDND